jgi:TonB family protein
MKLLLTTLFIFAISFGFGQQKKRNIYFLKNNGLYVTLRDSADYFRIVTEPDSGSTLYNVAEYYKDGKKKLIGKSSAIDPPVFEGQYARFYSNGRRQITANYKRGLEVGLEYYFYPNGKLYTMKEYPDNDDKYNDFTNNFLIKANYDSLGTALIENDNGYFKGYDDKFTYINEEGGVKNGKRDGLWKGNFKTFSVTFSENYKDGELINGTATFDDGNTAAYTKTRGTPPQFKGGLEAFSSYLGSNIQYPTDARENNIEGTVVLSFIVEKDGKVSDVKVSKSVSPSVDAEALRVIKNSSRWIPGTQFGRNVRVIYMMCLLPLN